MPRQELGSAYRHRDEGSYEKAVEELFKVAAITDDPIDHAEIILSVAAILTDLARFDEARTQLKAGQALLLRPGRTSENSSNDLRIKELRACLGFQEAFICRAEGKYEEALTKLDSLLVEYNKCLRLPEFRPMYQLIQSRRALLFGDLGRCKEAIPVLEEARTFEQEDIAPLQGEISFYLGSCYAESSEWTKAEPELSRSLRIGLAPNQEFRARCRLGKAYHKLEDYAQAKAELEKAAEKADASYIKEARLWEWLESTCRHLGLKSEAEHYAQLARPS